MNLCYVNLSRFPHVSDYTYLVTLRYLNFLVLSYSVHKCVVLIWLITFEKQTILCVYQNRIQDCDTRHCVPRISYITRNLVPDNVPCCSCSRHLSSFTFLRFKSQMFHAMENYEIFCGNFSLYHFSQ